MDTKHEFHNVGRKQGFMRSKRVPAFSHLFFSSTSLQSALVKLFVQQWFSGAKKKQPAEINKKTERNIFLAWQDYPVGYQTPPFFLACFLSVSVLLPWFLPFLPCSCMIIYAVFLYN